MSSIPTSNIQHIPLIGLQDDEPGLDLDDALARTPPGWAAILCALWPRLAARRVKVAAAYAASGRLHVVIARASLAAARHVLAAYRLAGRRCEACGRPGKISTVTLDREPMSLCPWHRNLGAGVWRRTLLALYMNAEALEAGPLRDVITDGPGALSPTRYRDALGELATFEVSSLGDVGGWLPTALIAGLLRYATPAQRAALRPEDLEPFLKDPNPAIRIAALELTGEIGTAAGAPSEDEDEDDGAADDGEDAVGGRDRADRADRAMAFVAVEVADVQRDRGSHEVHESATVPERDGSAGLARLKVDEV